MSLRDKISHYWDKRAKTYDSMRSEHLHSSNFNIWNKELQSRLPKDRQLRILDVGTATGYMAVCAASLGHQVTAIDISPTMITYAKESAKTLSMNIDFHIMDVHQLSFSSSFFDVIIMRNTSWTLIDVRKAYEECYRVLVPGGILLNYDANYRDVQFHQPDGSSEAPELQALYAECDELKSQLSISYVMRPQWDIAVLRDCGFIHCECDSAISGRFHPHGNHASASHPMFLIYAIKAASPELSDTFQLLFEQHIYLQKREQRFFYQLFESWGLPDTHFFVLYLLSRHQEGLRPCDISEYLLIPRQTMTRVIASLTKESYIESTVNPLDKRSVIIILTKEGKDYINNILQLFYQLQHQAMEFIDPMLFKECNRIYRLFLDALENSCR